MRDPIVSTANSLVKNIRSLQRSVKQRRNERLCVVEGVRLVEEALSCAVIHTVLYVPDLLEYTARGQQLLERLYQQAYAVETTSAVLASLSDVDSHQGILGLIEWPTLAIPELLSFVLLLDAVQDPGNLGTLLRSAEAAWVDLVLCLPGTVDIWNPKVLRAGMGAHFRLPILQVDSVTSAIQYSQGLPWYATLLEAQVSYEDIDWTQPSVVVIGNEANGISQDTAAHSIPITIPMADTVESLNASIAGSVILFEATRQRRQKNRP